MLPAQERPHQVWISLQTSCQGSLLSEQVSCALAVSRADSSGLYGLIVAKTYLQVSGAYVDEK